MSFKLLKVVRDALGCVRIGKAALAAAALCVATAPSPSLATDLEDFYLRHDFSSGARETSYGPNSSATKDIGTATATAVYGPDGAGTAVHPGNAWNDIFGSNNASSLVNSDWSVAASVRCAPVEGGVVFSLGRMNGNLKEVVLCSSSTNGKLYLKVLKRNGSSRTVESSTEATVSDTQDGYHAFVLVYKATATGQGTFTLYFDGTQVATVEATSSTPFGNGFQYSTLLSTTPSDYPNLGCANVSGNTALAFQDMRIFTSTLTAEDAAAYAALYPTALPAFTENLDQYAYVQSYGANGVDTGLYMTDTDKFTADFAFTDVSYKSWLLGAGKNANNQTHAIYLNGSKQLAWTNRGEWWWSTWPSAKIAGTSILDTRLRVTVNPGLTASVVYYDSRETKSSDATSKTATSTGPSIVTTHLFRGNGALMDNNEQACKAKLYSFEVDASATAITPRAFFAPAQDANGAAGFTNVVAGTFHGESMGSPASALAFSSGIGQASDYRYRSGKFYARIYAISTDASKGLVKFEGGEAAGTNAQFTARGRTAKISAVLPSGGTPQVKWSGDTWAIVGGTANDATITVKSDTAIRLVATISEAPVWKNNDGTGSLDSAENWTRAPGSGEDAVLELSGDTAITCAEAKTFGKMTITGAYSADFSGADVVSCSSVELDGVTNLVTGGMLHFAAINLPAACTMTITGAEGLGDGGLTGTGTLIIDPGAGNTYTMSKSNKGFTGEVIVKSGVARFGDVTSFGPVGRAAFIRVKGGAALDEGTKIYYYPDGGEKLSKAILEEGAKLQANEGYKNAATSELQYSVLTTINLEGNATVDTSLGIVTFAERWHYHATALNLGEYTLTVTGGKTFGVSRATITGTGTIDIHDGTTVVSTQSYFNDYSTTCADGTIRIREGGKWHLAYYYNNGIAHLSVKNLILDGSVTREKDTFTLDVTGSITGNGTTPMLKMGAGAVFKPTGTGYLTITESLSGTMTIDPSELDLSGGGTIPLFKTGTAEMLPAENEIAFAAGVSKSGRRLRKTADGLGYDLVRDAFMILIR